MKKTVLALALAALSTAASADINYGTDFTLTGNTSFTLSLSDPGWGPLYGLPEGAYTSTNLGTLVANNATTFALTVLGSQAADLSLFVNNGTTTAIDNMSPNATYSFATAAGVINFGFLNTVTGFTATNGGTNNNNIGYFANTFGLTDASGNPFLFLVGFDDDDSANKDHDDFVIGVSAVPVPAALPLMASALGMFGVARRRSKFA